MVYYILHQNEPYCVDTVSEKMYAADITPDGVNCEFKSPMALPKEIKSYYTHGEITALLAERIANATEMPKATTKGRKSKAIDTEE